MKRLLTLVMAGCMVLGTLGSAAALDVKVKGVWAYSYGIYDHPGFYSSQDRGGRYDKFQSVMRSRTQIDFISSETLSAMLHFEIGDMNYGRAGDGAGLDADQTVIKVKSAQIEWTLPNTNIQTRMGVQYLRWPMATGANPFFTADVAGVSFHAPFNDTIGLSGFWIRPYDANTGEDATTGNQYDEMDVFSLTLPVRTKDIRVTPWGAVSSAGRNSGFNTATHTHYSTRNRYIPMHAREDQSLVWWAGTALELPILDPFYVKFDAIMGGQKAKDNFGTFGWMLATDSGYKWSWGKTSLLAWYSSGDKGKSPQGSTARNGENYRSTDRYGTIPVLSDDTGWTMVNYAMAGRNGRNLYKMVSSTGVGTWGLGFEVSDVSFVDKLKHGIQVTMLRGTNEGSRIDGNTFLYGNYNAGPTGHAKSASMYLISTDTVYNLSLQNEYQFTKEFSMAFDLAAIHLDLSKQRPDSVRDTATMYMGALSFQYRF